MKKKKGYLFQEELGIRGLDVHFLTLQKVAVSFSKRLLRYRFEVSQNQYPMNQLEA